jgi:hypothetical protein
MHAAERWRGRLLTLEAMAMLITARILVACVPLARWRSTLGEPTHLQDQVANLCVDNRPAHALARAVTRAARRLPGENRCLPQAMSLQWMLHRRGLGGMLLIGVRPGSSRGGIDDLHAWIVRGDEALLGATEDRHRAVFAAIYPPRQAGR